MAIGDDAMDKLMRYIILGMIAFMCGVAQAGESMPKIRIITEDVDLGEMRGGRVFDYKIEVKNAGAKDLIIENVYSTCGCLEVTDKRWPIAAEHKKAVLKPGQSTYVAVKMDTNKVFGRFQKVIHVISNDPDNKDVVWKIMGTVTIDAGAGLPMSETKDNVTEDTKIIMVFYSPGCNDCKEIMGKFLPGLKAKYENKILITDYNIDNPEALAFLLDLQNKYDDKSKAGFFNPRPPVVFAGNKLLYGAKEIEEKLEAVLWIN